MRVPAVIVLGDVALPVLLGLLESAKAAFDKTEPSARAFGGEAELDEQRIALVRLDAIRVRPTPGEVVRRIDLLDVQADYPRPSRPARVEDQRALAART